MMAIALVVEIEVKPSQEVAFLSRLKQHSATSLAQEPGCRQFDVMVPQEGERRFMIYEVYEDAAAAEAHADSAHLAAYRADTADMIADRRITRCDIVTP